MNDRVVRELKVFMSICVEVVKLAVWGGYLQSGSKEGLTDILASALMGKLLQEYDLSIEC